MSVYTIKLSKIFKSKTGGMTFFIVIEKELVKFVIF